MASLRLLVSEPSANTPRDYHRRVHALAVVFVCLFIISLAGIGMLCWRGRYFVTLSQRSNVETLTLAFFLVLFFYVVLLTREGFWGSLRMLWYGRPGGDAIDREKRKLAALQPESTALAAALNVLIRREGHDGERSFTIPVADEAGEVGKVELAGARVVFISERKHSSNNILAYISRQLDHIASEKEPRAGVDIVAWKSLNDEDTERYLSMVRFAENLEGALKSGPLWPALTLTEEDTRKLERSLSEVCPALRSEAFLPDWEYSAEHKLPIIPEPLGLASLGRVEQRADPLVAMSLLLGIVTIATAALVFLTFFPPWLPRA